MAITVPLTICRNERDCIRRHRKSADDLRAIDGGSTGYAWGSATSVGSLRTTTLATSNSSNSMNAASPSGPKASGISVAPVA